MTRLIILNIASSGNLKEEVQARAIKAAMSNYAI